MLSFSNRSLHRRVQGIHSCRYHVVTPPIWRSNAVHRERKENEQRAQGQAQIKTRAGQVIKSWPPSEVPLSNELLEYKANNAPWQVIERGRRRNGACSAEDQGCQEILDWGVGISAGGKVENDRDNGTDSKEDKKTGVDLPWGEDSWRADKSPNHRCWLC